MIQYLDMMIYFYSIKCLQLLYPKQPYKHQAASLHNSSTLISADIGQLIAYNHGFS